MIATLVLAQALTARMVPLELSGPKRISVRDRRVAIYRIRLRNRSDKAIAVLWRKFESGLEVSQDGKTWSQASDWGKNERAMRPRAEDFVVVPPHQRLSHDFMIDKSAIDPGSYRLRGLVFATWKTELDRGMDAVNFDRPKLASKPVRIRVAP